MSDDELLMLPDEEARERERADRLARRLSFVLRHDPAKFHVKLDEYGFADLKELARALKTTPEEIGRIVLAGEKARFEIVGDKIRALYGHSLPIKPASRRARPPRLLYCAVARRALDKALSEGLLPAERKYVHLTTTEKEAREVGLRRDTTPVILRIAAQEADSAGIAFYKSGDIYLTAWVPTRFLSLPRKTK